MVDEIQLGEKRVSKKWHFGWRYPEGGDWCSWVAFSAADPVADYHLISISLLKRPWNLCHAPKRLQGEVRGRFRLRAICLILSFRRDVCQCHLKKSSILDSRRVYIISNSFAVYARCWRKIAIQIVSSQSPASGLPASEAGPSSIAEQL